MCVNEGVCVGVCVCVGGFGGMCGENINGAVMKPALSLGTKAELRQRSAVIFLLSFNQFQFYLDTLAALLLKHSCRYRIWNWIEL